MIPILRRLMEGIKADVVAFDDGSGQECAPRLLRQHVIFRLARSGRWCRHWRNPEQIDNTVVIVTADHGDMLGERGLWYKMNFFEHSARVPLVMAGPGVAKTAVAEPCSLVDLLPTFLDIAANDETPQPPLGLPLDGRSLWSLATGAARSGDGEVIAEYCAECASHPLFMIRRGRFKYIHCDVDPPQLYDLEADPAELINLVVDPEHADIAAAFAAEVSGRWQSEAIRQHVIATQRQRRAVHAAMEAGALTSWDYQPRRDASQEFVRNHMDWTEAAAKTRFPPFASPDDGGQG